MTILLTYVIIYANSGILLKSMEYKIFKKIYN
nr:MAG TPA: hypothetical protein [Caudoviricetes sp.]